MAMSDEQPIAVEEEPQQIPRYLPALTSMEKFDQTKYRMRKLREFYLVVNGHEIEIVGNEIILADMLKEVSAERRTLENFCFPQPEDCHILKSLCEKEKSLETLMDWTVSPKDKSKVAVDLLWILRGELHDSPCVFNYGGKHDWHLDYIRMPGPGGFDTIGEYTCKECGLQYQVA